ncbi:MAG: GDP-mannose 4,6-dehydratase [Candidatus Aenigmarchaeota archaeon]|nr:GDP-mannose 4,6-dehydratase [Candidatus Aenigmarchaeota archaeon]
MGFWKGKSVLVTGANGFTGSNLCRALLEEGANVKAFVKRGGLLLNLNEIKSELSITIGDVTDLTSLIKAMDGVDYVFHSAAVVPVVEAREVPANTLQVNIMGTFNVAWVAMRSNVKRMLHISTCHIYGNQPEDKLPLKEDTTPNPADIYSSSKYAAELVIKPLIAQGFDIVISRAFNKYGPGQRGDFFIPKVVSQVLRGIAPKLGNPNPTRDYSYVMDIVKGYMAIVEKGEKGEMYHLCSGVETRIGDFCNEIIEACGSNVKPVWESTRSQDISRSYGDCSKAIKELGWKPKTSLKDGLRLTVEWWKEHPELLKI